MMSVSMNKGTLGSVISKRLGDFCEVIPNNIRYFEVINNFDSIC